MSINPDSRVHIALSPWDLTDDYNRHAGVTVLSALNHCSRPTTIHLLYDSNLSKGKEKEEEYNKKCYQEIADRYGCDIQYHHVDLPNWILKLDTVKKWTPGTLMRLYLPELLPDVHKILYLDCDMVVLTSIDKLFDTVIDDKYLAACMDNSIDSFGRKRKIMYKMLGIEHNTYFCAGILLINLDKLRQLKPSFTSVLLSYLKENPTLPYLDQDLLNWFCMDEYKKLDQKYNVYADRKDSIKYSGDCILHYADKAKPWVRYSGDIDDFYWNYLLQTPWCKSKSDVLKYSMNVVNIAQSRQHIAKYVCEGREGNKINIVLEELNFLITYFRALIVKIFQTIMQIIRP